MRNYQNSRPNRIERDMRNDPDTDHYIPNYERDGYIPGPRYGNKPEVLSNPPFAGPNNPGPGGFAMMGKVYTARLKPGFTNQSQIDMMNPQMVNQGWAGGVGRYAFLL